MLKILFIGDIVGKIGRKTVAEILPKLKKKLKPDLVIANTENIAHGSGITTNTLKEVLDAGINWATGGDHSFKAAKQTDEVYNGRFPILRPANFADNVPGQGQAIITIKKHKILLINLIGRVFMHMDYNCPLASLDSILASFAKQNLSAIIVDIHAEATSEKVSFGHFVDGRASAVLGTHTHVMTADQRISKKGTAYITDVGMVGFADGSLGLDKEGIIKTYLTQIKYPHIIPEQGKAIFNAVFVTINPRTKKAVAIKPILEKIVIGNL